MKDDWFFKDEAGTIKIDKIEKNTSEISIEDENPISM